MNPALRKHAAHALMAASLLLNAALIGYLAHSGGLRRIFVRMDLAELPAVRQPFQKELEARYRKYPNMPADLIFAGDSHVGAGPWAEFYGDVHNRGIGGDTTADVLRRLDEIIDSKPRKLFLLLGTNDFSLGATDAQYFRNYRALLRRVREESPDTKVAVISMPPVNSSFPGSWVYDNAKVRDVNEHLRGLVGEFPGVGFIDLTPSLVDDRGDLRREFTPDGIHLNDDAYLAIRGPIGQYVVGDGPPGGKP